MTRLVQFWFVVQRGQLKLCRLLRSKVQQKSDLLRTYGEIDWKVQSAEASKQPSVSEHCHQIDGAGVVHHLPGNVCSFVRCPYGTSCPVRGTFFEDLFCRIFSCN